MASSASSPTLTLPSEAVDHQPDTPPSHESPPTSIYTSNTIHKPESKPVLKLPSSQKDWAEADLHFQENLVPAVVSEPSVQAKNRILCDGIYAYFSERYGTKQPKTDRNTKRRQKHDRALKRVKQLKGDAKKEFQRAKREGLQPETIQSLARNFYKLVREHNQLKKASHNANLSNQARKARQHCHQHFWQYAKELLDDNATNQASPQF